MDLYELRSEEHMAKPILLIIAAVGFQPTEYHNTKRALERAGLTVVTVSDQAGKAVASDGQSVIVEKGLDAVMIDQYEGIFLIGGPGALEHLHTPAVMQLMGQAVRIGMPYGAICISPRILAEAGLLTDKRATGWNEDQRLPGIFKKGGVRAALDQDVVVDGMAVTATGPRAATAFGEAIARVVKAYRTKA